MRAPRTKTDRAIRRSRQPSVCNYTAGAAITPSLWNQRKVKFARGGAVTFSAGACSIAAHTADRPNRLLRPALPGCRCRFETVLHNLPVQGPPADLEHTRRLFLVPVHAFEHPD